MTGLDGLRKRFLDQFNEVQKTMETHQQQLAQLEVQREQLRGAVHALDQALRVAQTEELKKAEVVTPVPPVALVEELKKADVVEEEKPEKADVVEEKVPEVSVTEEVQ